MSKSMLNDGLPGEIVKLSTGDVLPMILKFFDLQLHELIGGTAIVAFRGERRIVAVRLMPRERPRPILLSVPPEHPGPALSRTIIARGCSNVRIAA
jgi:hypothetical protein